MRFKLVAMVCAVLLGLPIAATAQTDTLTQVPISTPTATATLTPTATPTLTPTAQPTQTPYVITATPTPTPTANLPQLDLYEPNNSRGAATRMAVPGQIDKANFYPVGDVDYFALTIKPSQAGLTLTLDTYVDSGIDTTLRLFDAQGSVVAENDDSMPTDPRSHIAVLVVPGEYILEVANQARTFPDFKTYRLEAQLALPVAPDATATPMPLPEPEGAWDQFNGTNYTWDNAPLIPIGEELAGLTFGCPVWDVDRPACAVADFFKIPVKAGTCYTAETLHLAAGVDTNLIVYSDQRDQAAPLSGNDDRTRTDFSSAATFCSPYTGEAYVLIGQAGSGTPPPPIKDRTYSLLITLWSAPAPTAAVPAVPSSGLEPLPAPAPVVPVAPPLAAGESNAPPAAPPTSEALPIEELLTGVLIEELRPDQGREPTPTTSIVIPIAVLACYDRNLNQSCDIDEGIAGLTVYVSASATGEVMGQAITDQNGRAQMTVRAAETASLNISVPSFAASQTINARNPQTRPILVKAAASLPALIP